MVKETFHIIGFTPKKEKVCPYCGSDNIQKNNKEMM